TLPGPTGETNQYHLKPRGTVLCHAASSAGAQAQLEACQRTGNDMLWVDHPEVRAFLAARPEGAGARWVAPEAAAAADFQAVLYEGDGDGLQTLSRAVAERSGPIVPILARRVDELSAGKAYPLEMLVREASPCTTNAPPGTNARLTRAGRPRTTPTPPPTPAACGSRAAPRRRANEKWLRTMPGFRAGRRAQ